MRAGGGGGRGGGARGQHRRRGAGRNRVVRIEQHHEQHADGAGQRAAAGPVVRNLPRPGVRAAHAHRGGVALGRPLEAHRDPPGCRGGGGGARGDDGGPTEPVVHDRRQRVGVRTVGGAGTPRALDTRRGGSGLRCAGAQAEQSEQSEQSEDGGAPRGQVQDPHHRPAAPRLSARNLPRVRAVWILAQERRGARRRFGGAAVLDQRLDGEALALLLQHPRRKQAAAFVQHPQRARGVAGAQRLARVPDQGRLLAQPRGRRRRRRRRTRGGPGSQLVSRRPARAGRGPRRRRFCRRRRVFRRRRRLPRRRPAAPASRRRAPWRRTPAAAVPSPRRRDSSPGPPAR